MQKMITRSFSLFTVTIKDGENGEVVENYPTTSKPDKAKIAVKFIKKTGKTNILIDIVETETMREMPLEVFINNSTVVVPKVVKISELQALTEPQETQATEA